MESPFFSTEQTERIQSKIIYIIGSNEDINISKYNKLNTDELNNFCKKLFIIPSNKRLLYIKHHVYNLKLINGLYLNLIDDNKYNEKEAIVCIWGIKKNYIESYIKQFDIYKNLHDYFKIIKLNNYFKLKNYYTDLNRLNLLIDAPESKYWTIKKHCNRNINKIFIQRNFKDEIKKIKDKNVLTEINNAENTDHDYLLFMHNSKYTDIANSLTDHDYYNYIIDDLNEITHDELYDIVLNITSLKELYFFVSTISLTKEYCHLIINNKKVLTLLNDINFIKNKFNTSTTISFINKYILMFKYIINYCWIIFYTEESIKKSYITETDRFVFDADTASLLPSFIFSNKNPKSNPYFTLLLNNDIIDYPNNINSFGSVKLNNTEHIDFYKISTLEEFKKKLNIFCNYKYTINDIFLNINWDNIAIGGSVMAACLPNYNPLQYYFKNKINKFEKYIEHFYKDSDLDIMCNCENIIDYINTFFRFFKQLSDNINKLDNTEKLNYNIKKSVYFYIDSSIIYKLKIKLNLSENEIINNLNNNKILDEVYNYYLEYHLQYIEQYMKDEIFTIKDYNFLFEPCNKNSLIIQINKAVDTPHLFTNIKFEIYASEPRKVLRKNIEFFKIKYKNFFSSVSKFHLNCVRSYYNGVNVYILPSCITALKTYINIDLKYFAGSNSPYKIIEKYRFRGFGTILNNLEKIAYVEYIINKQPTPNYNVNVILKNIIGIRKITNYKYYNIHSNYINICNNIINLNNDEDICRAYCNILGFQNKELISFILKNTYSINYQGSINYYKDYIIKLIYDKF